MNDQTKLVRYEIRVRGLLSETFLGGFPAMEARIVGHDTVLSGELPDQAALYGVLNQVEGLGLELLEVGRAGSPRLGVREDEQAPDGGSREIPAAGEPRIAALLRHRSSRNPNVLSAEQAKRFGERMSDRLTIVAGSWTFILSFLGILAIWISINVAARLSHWDPYPFILLNLILSCVAAIQSPIILMSQNREEARDRIRAEADYDVNLKAEVLLEHLTTEVETLKVMLAGKTNSSNSR